MAVAPGRARTAGDAGVLRARAARHRGGVFALPALRAQAALVREHPAAQLRGAARQVPRLRRAHQLAVPLRRAADGAVVRGLRVALRRRPGRRAGAVFLRLPGGAGGHRPAHHPAPGCPDPAAAVGRPARQPGHRLRRSRAGDPRRRRRLPVPVAGVLAVQAGHWQGRHGRGRLQAAGRARRLVRPQLAAGYPAAVLRGRRAGRQRLAAGPGQGSLDADSLRSLPGDRRLGAVLLPVRPVRPGHALAGAGLGWPPSWSP